MTALAPGSSNLLSRGAVIATAMMFGLTYSLSATLIALDLAERGLDEAVIGANAAMHAVGILATAMVLPRVVAKVGVRPLILGALVLAAVTLVGFPLAPFIWLWFPLRFILGVASETLFVLSETWINSLSTEATRARAMASYTAALSVGFALGPLILSIIGTAGALPYVIGAGLALFSALFVASPKVPAPTFDAPTHSNPIHYMRLAPLALSATLLNAALEAAGLSFLAIYAVNVGWAESDATRLITCMMVGAILLQLPIGWLGDKMDRRRLVIILALIATLGALVWPLTMGHEWAAYALLFVFGGAFVGVATIMLTVVGSRFKGGELVGIYAVMGLVWGGGALVGPLAAGLSMQVFAHGLAYFAAIACAAFALAAILLKRTS
ncbi:MFS transporter [Aquabacter spiritensis]|uniref:Putative MFS family arabinose efflux permease n=1 Tax=Aquabacter spiritensis TaxID=933073 RepID=A0A4R3M7H9_9HYPH|nr:MFS transporter [Aquabacter spiritensis]TCT07567.1 putative MFS family arabinose efflux permease [Aquabacter spiritensis]